MKASWRKCPHCGKLLEFKLEGGGGTAQDFGQPVVFKCPKCSGRISNGLKEWPNLSFFQKFKAWGRLVFTIILYGGATGGILTAIAMFAFGLNEEQVVSALLIIGTLSLVAFSVVYGKTMRKEIRESSIRAKSANQR